MSLEEHLEVSPPTSLIRVRIFRMRIIRIKILSYGSV